MSVSTTAFKISVIPSAPANQNSLGVMVDPLATYQGVLPNGEQFVWALLGQDDIPAILHLQDTVAASANELEKNFLIKRSAGCFEESMAQGHLYWGAYSGENLVSLFGLADNDEEVGDGRGQKTPKKSLGVSRYNQVSILKGAQVHPKYRDQGLGAIGALARYIYFLENPDKQVIMTKVHAGNNAVCENYINNGFLEACRTPVTDHSHTFNVVTFKAERSVLQGWIDAKMKNVMLKYSLVVAD
ncbi:MAG TPA: hypothetical protein VGF14_02255 [Alphaproteobacteria bacterium]